MSKTKNSKLISASAPDGAEQAAWQQLSREEQLAQYRTHLANKACDADSEADLSEILTEARAKAGVSHRG